MVKESACNVGHLGSIPGLGRSPGEGTGEEVFLPRESQGQKSLVGYSSWGRKESDVTEHACNQLKAGLGAEKLDC